jgi:hypothetical protein
MQIIIKSGRVSHSARSVSSAVALSILVAKAFLLAKRVVEGMLLRIEKI